MSDTLAHTFDCECNVCLAGDATATGMALFSKARNREGLVATNVRIIDTPTVKTEPIRRLPAGQRVGNGRVRKISAKQEGFILSLISARDTTDLHLVTGQTLDPNEIPYMGVKGASALIEKLLGCPFKGTNVPVHTVAVTNGIPATEKQISFISSLADRKGFNLTESLSGLTKQSASRMIETLMSMADKPRSIAPVKSTEVATVKATEVTEGMYTVGPRIFKVQAAKQTGNLYAKELIDGKFEYVAGAISIVRREGIRMSIEEAKAYGKRTGQCCVCSRELTVKASIDMGIGPICASKF
jgi:hypothetical protein